MRAPDPVESGVGHPDALIQRVEANAEIHDVPANGHRVRWRVFGHGSPLVLLHGGHGSWLHWIRNVEALAQEHRVLVPDMPGFHDSDDLEVDSADGDILGALVERLREGLRTLLGATTAFGLVGFSFGGLVAARVAAVMPEVRRLALLGPAGHGLPRRQTEPLENWRASSDPFERREALRRNLNSFMLRPAHGRDELALAIHERSCMRTRLRSRALSRAGGLQALLSALQPPVLMLWGEDDVTAHPAEVAVALREGRLDREWCLLAEAGHWVQYERPAEVNNLLLGWFRRPS